MSAVIALLVASLRVSVPGGFEDALRLSAQGEHANAYVSARAEVDPLRRAQACLYVLHHAGDLEGALHEGAYARDQGLSDAWLLEREAYVALTLGRAHAAGPALLALGLGLDARDPADPEVARLRAAAEALAREAAAREELERERDAALLRARAVGIGLGFVPLLVVSWLTFRPGYGRRNAQGAALP